MVNFSQPNYSLSAFSSVLQNNAFVRDLMPLARNYRRSIRLQGGFWEGSFDMMLPESEAQEVYYNWLGYHIEERAGAAISYEAMAYALELEVAGVRRRRGFETFANHVKANYTDTSSNPQTTAAATDAESIKRYGQYEEILSPGEGEYAAAVANSRRDRYLELYANAPSVPISINLDGADDKAQGQIMGARNAIVAVQLCGYIFTAQWKHVTTNDDATGNVSAWIDSIVTTDCEFLSSTQITTNALQVKRTLGEAARAWDVLQDMTALGDGTSVYTLKVIPGRGVVYAPLDTTPQYYILPGGIFQRIGANQTVNPWLLQPGIYRDMRYPVGGVPLDGATIYEDIRDILVEEVEVSQEGNVTLKTAAFEESELLAGWASG